ncbi:hypothetical protein GNI_099800 [Gregarina niphandrodes]|uniref:Uncharacterized protein n=1 Tax=Gregarina niphandrodes TaxID=110365 RepID=A0A023B4X6_GRENI|nr:hypothetical protein GNI_099800 [Gregarina niphandrodes]EZG57004.1 hypothetical protein GNI_099800 [Gregarina niphandrodes]|eukprot:XP_011131116.1 hypothetical protein GNI_099800 [Gregarina niphandrodes]
MFPSVKRVSKTPRSLGTVRIQCCALRHQNLAGGVSESNESSFDALLGQGVECYIDDIVIYSGQECLELLNKVMRICIGNGFFLKLAKRKCGIKPQPGKVEALSSRFAKRLQAVEVAFMFTLVPPKVRARVLRQDAALT